MAKQVVLKNVIIQHPQLLTAIPYENNAPRFGARLIFPEGKVPQDIYDVILEVARDEFGQATTAASLEPTITGTKSGTLAGVLGMSAYSREASPPTIVDQTRAAITDPNLIFGGCIVNAVVGFYANKKGKKTVYVGLNMIQLVDSVNITRLDSGMQVDEAFETLDVPVAPITSSGAAKTTRADDLADSMPF